MRERPNRHAWKACVGQPTVGSNPTPSAQVTGWNREGGASMSTDHGIDGRRSGAGTRSRKQPSLLRQLRRRTVPTWWQDAKLGIFIHWTLASVPGFATVPAEQHSPLVHVPNQPLAAQYTEWYLNSLRFPASEASRYHREHYGDRPYESFVDEFTAGLAHWNPTAWAEQFARTGARYVVMVTKHHDGYCPWPTSVPNPRRANWFSERDIVGELADAVRAAGMRFGLYYSGGIDWTFEDRPISTFADLVAAVPSDPEYGDYAEAQVRELIERYEPSVLWNDIAWPFGGDRLWQLFSDYYAAVPDGVVNDRWMPRGAAFNIVRTRPGRAFVDRLAVRSSSKGRTVPPQPPHFDVRTPEYSSFDTVQRYQWETCRGMDRSFGYNRMSGPEHFMTRSDLLGSFVDIVAKGGNLLLNVGPRGEDSTIPDEQAQRLTWLAEWSAAGGHVLSGTRPWVFQEGTSREGHHLRYAARDEAVHVAVLDGPAGYLTLTDVDLAATGVAVGPGGRPLTTDRSQRDLLRVDLGPSDGDNSWPFVFTLTSAVARPRR